MRRDVQLFLGKQVVNPPSTGVNLVSNPSINDETDYDFLNHATVIGGQARLNTLRGSETNFRQTISDLQPNKKYQLRVSNLSYDAESLVVNRAFASEDFASTVWTKSSITVTSNSTVAPDGTTTADSLLSSSTFSTTYQPFSVVANEPVVISAYVKSDTASNVTLNVFKDNIFFNVSTSVISSTAKFSNVGSIYAGNGWYRVYGTYTNTASSSVNASVKLPDNGQSMYVWGFQLERASSLGLYIRNSSETAAAYSYVNQTQQTVENKLLYSEDISNAAWAKTRVNLTSGVDGFLGNNLGFNLTSSLTSQTSYVFEDTPITEDGDYVVTTYVKAVTATYASFRVESTSDSRKTDYSLRFSDGLLTDKGTTSGFLNSIESTYMYDGWWKVEFYVNLTTSSGNLRIIASQRSSDGSWFTAVGAISSMDIAHTQIIKGSVAGQYIPTFGSAMSLSKPNNRINIYDASDGGGGLLYSNALSAGTTSFVHDFITNDNTGELRIEIEANNATAQIEVDTLYLSERIDAYTSTERFAVDMFDFEDLNLVDKIKDVRDISKVFTEYSQKFTVPASANNNQLFDHFYNEDVISGFDHRVKHDAVIKIGGADYKHGQLTLLSSTLKNGKPHSYSVVFYGNTVKLNDLLGDDQLSDLTGTILDKLNIEYNSGNIFDLMTYGMFFDENNDLVVGTDNGVNADTPDLFVPFISCDSHYFYDSVDQPQVKDRVSSRNVKFGSAQATRGIYYKDLKLAVKIKYIIQAIQEKYGVTFSNDFFNDSIKEYSELSILLHKEKGGISSQLETSTDSFTLSDLSIVSPTFSELGNTDFRGVARYGGPDAGWDRDYLDFIYANSFVNQQGLERGYYSHKIEFDVEVVGSGEYGIDVIDTSEFGPENTGFSWRGTGNKSVELIFRGGQDNNAGTAQGVYYYFYKPRFTVSTQAGISEYKITNFRLTPVSRQASQRYGSPVSAWDEQNGGRGYRYNDEELNQLNSGVQLSSQLPNMKVIDFLTSLFKTFNLTAYSVPETDLSEYAGQIRVRPLDAYYLSGNEVDISPYVDTSKKIVNRNKLFSEVNFEFDKLSTLAAIKAYERTGDTFGNERMNNLSASLQNPLAFDGGKYSVKNKFEKVMYERMTDQSDESTILPIQWGWMASKDENPIVGKPLLFYPIYQGVSGTTDEQGDIVALDYDTSIYDKNKNVITQSHAQFDSYIRPSNSLQFNGSSLNFGSEYDEWYVWEGSGSNENSLFNNYYSNYLLSIYDIQSRLISIETHLPVEIVMKLKLNDVVIINKKRFRINSLDLNITTGAAKMELMNDLVYGSLYVEAIIIALKNLVSGVYRIDIADYSSNAGTSYKIYANGVFVREFIGTYGMIYDSDLLAGLNEVTVRKCVQYDANTSQESYDSNIIEITV